MPEIARVVTRMNCTGIDLVSPIDRMPEGSFPYLFNARILSEGRIDGRPGYTPALALADPPNSIRRLNDTTGLAVPKGYIYLGGGGTKLYSGIEGAYNPIDAGYSGDPLSLISFRPDQSPQSWMYVYDRLKQAKVRPDGILQDIGVVPPSVPPDIEYGIPASVEVDPGTSTTGWTGTGVVVGSPTLEDRTISGAVTIGNILYNDSNVGWACIQPVGTITTTFWMGNRMQATLNAGQPNEELVTVREIHPAIVSTTVESIFYDSGSIGPCSMVLVGSPIGLSRNSLINVGTGLGSELIRVLEVNLNPDGSAYSIRCETAINHVAGEAVAGAISWYCYTTKSHLSTETISAHYVKDSVPSAGTGGIAKLASEDLSSANGRPISTADDYMHVSIWLQNPQNVTEIHLKIDIDDGTTSVANAFIGNYWEWKIPQTQLANVGSDQAWIEIVVPLSSATRFGTDFTRMFSSVKAVGIELVTTGSTDFGLDYWYFFGTYGPTIQPNSPVGYTYTCRFRNLSTGAKSVPGPVNRYMLFPLREAVTVTPPVSAQIGVDTTDIYRVGGAIEGNPLYVSSVANKTPAVMLTDGLPDSAVLSVNQAVDLTAIQPWPIEIPPIVGVCNVYGTTVEWISGDGKFPLQMLNATSINLNGKVYQTYGQPRTQFFLEITQDAGSMLGATFQIQSPVLAGQPLPFVFGPLEGPFAPVVFGLGDINNEGKLYFSNFNDADSASDANTLEVSTPSAGLVSGAVWNGLCFCGSRDDLYVVRYSYLTSIGASNNTTYQWARVPVPSGIWSRWACCACPIGVAYLGRDGIYISTEGGAVNISDAKLYPLFPHDGQAASPVNSGSNIISPVDMTQPTKLRLTYCDEALRFSFIDTAGNYQTLIYEIYKKRWLLNNYANHINLHYLVEKEADSGYDPDILLASLDTNSIMLAGGNDDNGTPINTVVLTPSFDGGDERMQKLFVDTMTQADLGASIGSANLVIAATFNNAEIFSPVLNVTVTPGIKQYLENIASLSDLTLYRNIGCKYAWTGGPNGPRLYAFEASGFLQPYLSSFMVTQQIIFSFPGWKSMRRMYPALISTGDVLMTVLSQDGRSYGPYTITNTNGRYEIIPQMLNHGIKDLAFALQLDGQGKTFALFLSDFTIEMKEWSEETFIKLAVFKS